MSLYLGRAPCWVVAPFWEVLVNLPCQQSWATLWSAVCPFQAGFSCPLHTGDAAVPRSLLSLSSFGSSGRAFPFHPARQTSFSIPLPLLQQPGD